MRHQQIQQVSVADVSDPATARAVSALADAVRTLQAIGGRAVTTASLVVGRNAVPHNLGRAPAFVGVTPSVADASFAFALVTDNPHPERQVLIDVVGVAQPHALILVM